MKMNNSLIMDFPLKGEWSTPNTPGSRIPSHGTNALGTRYAYDFLQVDHTRRGSPCYRTHFLRYLLFGISIHQCYCYGETVYAPCEGTVVKIEDHYIERQNLHVFSDLYRAWKNSRLCKKAENIQQFAGNYIIIQHQEHVFVAFCHLQPGSLSVSLGQKVKSGDCLGCIGHSGNSIFPHLHFQVMDRLDMVNAIGLPCSFSKYEVFEHGTWVATSHDIPKSTQRIRFNE